MVADVKRYSRPFSTLADGSEAALHLVELIGEEAGPLIGITCAVHGNEYSGPQTALELFRKLKTMRLKGRVLILPVANVPAFVENKRFTPLDYQNLNREFPGNPNGTYTQQLAAAISKEVLNVVDIHFDLHSGGDLCLVDYAAQFPGDLGLSRLFGSKVIYKPVADKQGTNFKGMTFSVSCETRGIPTVGIELGGGTIDQKPFVERFVEGVMNMMRALGVIEGEVTPQREDQVVINEIGIVRPVNGGWIETFGPANGEPVTDEAAIGQIVSPYTFETLEELHSPFANGLMIMQHPTRNLVQPGEYGFLVGNLDDVVDEAS